MGPARWGSPSDSTGNWLALGLNRMLRHCGQQVRPRTHAGYAWSGVVGAHGDTHVCGAPGGNVGPAARGVALIARKSLVKPAGVATTMHGQSVVRHTRLGRVTEIRFLGRPLEPIGPPGGGGICTRQSRGSGACGRHRPRHVEARWFACVADAEAAVQSTKGGARVGVGTSHGRGQLPFYTIG